MKATKSQIKKANICLSKFNLELEDNYGVVGCFCTEMKASNIELENMQLIRNQIKTADTIEDILFMSYFRGYEY